MVATAVVSYLVVSAGFTLALARIMGSAAKSG